MGTYDKQVCIVFDIDGTLANVDHRRCWVDGSKGHKDFDKFYDLMDEDPSFIEMVGLCNMFYMNNWTIVFCTGRPESYRETTQKWLQDHGVLAAMKAEETNLMMRPDELRYKPDNIIKQHMIDELKEQGIEIHMAFDDRDQVVKMWRQNGIKCLQVADGKF